MPTNTNFPRDFVLISVCIEFPNMMVNSFVSTYCSVAFVSFAKSF